MNYLVSWSLSATNHEDYPRSVEMPLPELEALVLKLQNKDQVIYVNNVIPDGRLLIWGKNKTHVSLELQYSTHWYDRDILRSEFKEYIGKIDDIAKRPEEYGFYFGE